MSRLRQEVKRLRQADTAGAHLLNALTSIGYNQRQRHGNNHALPEITLI